MRYVVKGVVAGLDGIYLTANGGRSHFPSEAATFQIRSEAEAKCTGNDRVVDEDDDIYDSLTDEEAYDRDYPADED